MPTEFRVYRAANTRHPEERQEMIVPDPNRGFICATEVNEKRAMQWAHTFSATQQRETFEVRSVKVVTNSNATAATETIVAKFKGGRKFL